MAAVAKPGQNVIKDALCYSRRRQMRTKVKLRGVIYHPPREELDEDVALLLGLHVGMDGFLISGALHANLRMSQ